MAHATLERFRYPENVVAEYHHWAVLLRPEQVTAGSLVLACKEDAERLPDISAQAFAELQTATRDLEAALKAAFSFDKINYLMLMMVDRHVHFHVFPRYATDRRLDAVVFRDAGWPRHPAMAEVTEMRAEQFADLLEYLRSQWPPNT